MKLQRFIENYQRNGAKTPPSRQNQHSHVFRTSQSIGTLNSHDQFVTDRSFVVKEHNYVSPKVESVEHLRDLCTSERQAINSIGEEIQVGYFRNEKEEYERGIKPYPTPTFEKVDSSGSRPFAKNKIQTIDKSLSFEMDSQEERDLYEQAPSALYQGYPTQQTLLLSHQSACFRDTFNQLSRQMDQLQAQNRYLQKECQRATDMGLVLSQKQNILSEEIVILSEQVGNTIQQNIEIENRIKEILLKKEMQKYEFISKQNTLLKQRPCGNKTGNSKMDGQFSSYY